MAKTVSEQFVEILAAAGVKRIYGIVGDSLNGLTDAIRRHGKIEWIHVRHEEVAAFAAGAEAHLTGELAVCAGSCGPGNLHLINGLFDCQRSRVPVLAIAAQIPSPEIGSGYFQETHPQQLFRECSHYCELISSANQMPRVLEVAIHEAVGKRGVSVVVIPGDVALQPASNAPSLKAEVLDFGVDLQNPNFAAMAEAVGIRAYHILGRRHHTKAMTMSPTFTIDIQVTGVSHSKREAIVSASPAGRTYVERVCKSEVLWDYDTDIHPGWASVHVRCVDHNGRSVTAEKLACILASESDTPVAFVRDIEGETAEVIEPGMDVKAERDALTKRQPQ